MDKLVSSIRTRSLSPSPSRSQIINCWHGLTISLALNFGLAGADEQAIRETLNRIGGTTLSLTSLRFGSFQEYLTRPDQSRHATEPPRRMLNCGPGFVHA